MPKIIIPKKFDIGANTIEVKVEPKLVYNDAAVGTAGLHSNDIHLQPSSETYPVKQDQLLHTFCHELFHQILFHMECHELCSDEKHVNLGGNFLAQFMKSSKGKLIELDL